jgi:hypothetical protein
MPTILVVLSPPGEADSLEEVGKERLVVVGGGRFVGEGRFVGGGRFVNSAEATPVIIDSAASTTPEQIEPRLDVCV